MSASYEVQDFQRQVQARSAEVPVLVDFWASWCGPCKSLGPVLEKMAGEANGRWELVKVNTEEHQELAQEFSISSIPAVKLFRNGAVVNEFVGFKSETEIQRWLDQSLPSPAHELLERAAELIDVGDLSAARRLLEGALAVEPQKAEAKLLLAEVLLSESPEQAVALLESIPADSDVRAHAAALVVIARAAQRSPEALPEDPLKPQAVALLEAIRRRDWDRALEAGVEVVERRPKYAEGFAGEVGKAIFRYLGIRHPIADKHYRRFSSALNS